MGVKRYELSDAQWARVVPLLPGKAGDRGRTGADNRLFVNSVLWVLRSGAHWHDLPDRYGKWKTAHKRTLRARSPPILTLLRTPILKLSRQSASGCAASSPRARFLMHGSPFASYGPTARTCVMPILPAFLSR